MTINTDECQINPLCVSHYINKEEVDSVAPAVYDSVLKNKIREQVDLFWTLNVKSVQLSTPSSLSSCTILFDKDYDTYSTGISYGELQNRTEFAELFLESLRGLFELEDGSQIFFAPRDIEDFTCPGLEAEVELIRVRLLSLVPLKEMEDKIRAKKNSKMRHHLKKAMVIHKSLHPNKALTDIAEEIAVELILEK